MPISGVLLSDGGPQVVRGVTGPYREGAAPLLRCRVRGGDPKPRITWWRDGVRLPPLKTTRYGRKIIILKMSDSNLTSVFSFIHSFSKIFYNDNNPFMTKHKYC